ncbi:DBH-like monooxygenase protein 1 homolog [Ruditapes philippinarum]|uniref:DBH-like monooxygenase protein 1 homolog n=1 Tax=Ruditapes philippinarum TaxID=129788 RepID=UPI00295AFA33|nr:DBH-like monooxygenase protein 1 homolog [Ruditapes philippinarum]
MTLKHKCLLILSLFPIISQVCTQTLDYKYYRALDYDRNYVMGWRFNDTHIDFELTVNTLGYVGFGFSDVGLMNPADILIGWISEGNMYLGDYHTLADSRTPYNDTSQDWVIQDGKEVNGTTILRFSRQLVTCDDGDRPITKDRIQLIWSFGGEDPELSNGLVPYHGETKRGSTSIILLESDVMPTSFPPANTFSIPLKNHEYIIPATGSTLQCIVFDLKSMIPEGHLIKYEADITPGNEAFVYRMNLYKCDLNDPSLTYSRFECENEAPNSVKSCKNIVATWSMGAQSFHFPENVGIQIGGQNDASSYVLEIHYSKYQETIDQNGVPMAIPDSSGLQITYTTSPIAHQAGMLELGKVISPGWRQIIPEQENSFTSTSVCSPRCMNWGFATDKTPMKAIAVILKGNDVASAIKVRHFRGNRELPWITVDRKFSNFHQAPRLLTTPVTIEPTDTLMVECTFNTSTRTSITVGGWSRVEETCRATVVYYPAKPFDMCLSWSSYDNLYSTNGTKIPEQRAAAFLGNVTQWDAPMKQQLRNALETSSERSICSSMTRQPAYAIDRYNLPAGSVAYKEPDSSCVTPLV